MTQNKVAFIAIVNNQVSFVYTFYNEAIFKDQPIYLKNFCSNSDHEIQFQLYTFTALEQIELQSILFIPTDCD